MSTLDEGMEGLDLQGMTNFQLDRINRWFNIVLQTVFIHFK
jgi:hypothetical protein